MTNQHLALLSSTFQKTKTTRLIAEMLNDGIILRPSSGMLNDSNIHPNSGPSSYLALSVKTKDGRGSFVLTSSCEGLELH